VECVQLRREISERSESDTGQSKATVRIQGSRFSFYRVVRRMNDKSYRQYAESDARRSQLLPLPFS
jgi:hypothetical protein